MCRTHPPPRRHPRQHLPGRAHAGHDIDVEAAAPSRFIVGERRGERGGVVDEDVDAFERCVDRLEEAVERRGIPDVAGSRHDLDAPLAPRTHRVAQRVRATGKDTDVRTLVRQRARDGAADCPAANGDDGAFAAKSEIHCIAPGVVCAVDVREDRLFKRLFSFPTAPRTRQNNGRTMVGYSARSA